MLEEAAATGRIEAVVRSLLRVAASGVLSFLATLGLFIGYGVGAALVFIAALKPVFPRNVGLWMRNGLPHSFGAEFPASPELELAGGYWVIPLSLAVGGVLLFVTHRLAQRWLAWARVHVLPQWLPSFWGHRG